MVQLTQDRLKELVTYIDGDLISKVDRNYKLKKGGKLGWLHKDTGYYYASIDNKKYKLHRLVFLYHNGYMPDIVDHIDMDKGNNRIENLREATKSQNMSNRGKQRNNTSGHKGVHFCNTYQKYKAQICVSGIRKSLGYYEDIEKAVKAYERAAKKYHGAFARLK